MSAPTHQRFEIDRSGDPLAELEQSAAAIRQAGWWKALGRPETWPLTDEQAVEMLSVAGQFEVTIEQLTELLARQIIPSPQAPDEWNASDILAAGFALEQRRQWRCPPSAHDAKRIGPELLFLKAVEEDSVEELREAISNFDLRQVLAGLVLAEDRLLKIHLSALLQVILLADHGVKV